MDVDELLSSDGERASLVVVVRTLFFALVRQFVHLSVGRRKVTQKGSESGRWVKSVPSAAGVGGGLSLEAVRSSVTSAGAWRGADGEARLGGVSHPAAPQSCKPVTLPIGEGGGCPMVLPEEKVTSRQYPQGKGVGWVLLTVGAAGRRRHDKEEAAAASSSSAPKGRKEGRTA